MIGGRRLVFVWIQRLRSMRIFPFGAGGVEGLGDGVDEAELRGAYCKRHPATSTTS